MRAVWLAVCIRRGGILRLGNYLCVGGGHVGGGDGVARGVGISWLGNDICGGAGGTGVPWLGNDICRGASTGGIGVSWLGNDACGGARAGGGVSWFVNDGGVHLSFRGIRLLCSDDGDRGTVL